ncbi:SRPBCC family protein [Chitinophaga sp. SYP-B3965]|uniref:SRPBCC family protein n=1 Tax=Chitinophaga sp. SYP-B3965 TaxID=2663120 RepID=UPI001299AEA6|nr:SRPBCC family protein [Chitinophaga sp. SYP-B3965]MRG47214.1 SRPBCC family protein [Chitinophaga sp. SYP-B3965]
MNLSISINRNADEVYTFISNAENLPQWAAGLCTSIQKTETENVWRINGGEARVRFVEKNKFRVADHYVRAKPGAKEVYIPIRVLDHDGTSEVVFTLFRLPEMTDDEFKRDMGAVQKDLQTIKEVIERN